MVRKEALGIQGCGMVGAVRRRRGEAALRFSDDPAMTPHESSSDHSSAASGDAGAVCSQLIEK